MLHRLQLLAIAGLLVPVAAGLPPKPHGTLGGSPATAAQHPCPGHLSATALEPVPAGSLFGTTLSDESPTQHLLRERLFESLRATGHKLGDPPTHLLSWRGILGTSGVAGGLADRLQHDMGSHHDSDDLRWMQALPRSRLHAAPAARWLHAVVELRARESEHVVWIAVLSCERHGSDPEALAETLIGAVVPAIGHTVTIQPF